MVETLVLQLPLLIVFVGMAALLWRQQSSLQTALLEVTQLLAGRDPAKAAPPVFTGADVSALGTPSVQFQKPAAAPPSRAPADAAPPWLALAQKEIGFHEVGNNGGIEKYIALAHCGAEGDPWCAIFVNAMLEAAGVPGTRSASSQSFRTHPEFVRLERPYRGAIAVFWRGSGPDSGIGHVGFYWAETDDRVWVIGGNQDDAVRNQAFSKRGSGFGLVGYYSPKSWTVPATSGPVAMPAEAKATVAAASEPGSHTGIVATVFDPSRGSTPAYGAFPPSRPGVALPARISGERPRVRVTNRANGKSVECDVCDVGPWNTKDDYWSTPGARPQAESGTDLFGRRTNKAGIDLTPAAAEAIGLDGKGVVDWMFLGSVQKVT